MPERAPHAPFIDPSARVAASAVFGRDVEIQAGAYIGEKVHCGEGVRIGCHAIIEADVDLGDGVVVDHNAVIRAGTNVGKGTAVGAGAILGQHPSRAKSSTLGLTADLAPLTVGPECQIGAAAIVYAGSRIGSGCFIADAAQVRERCSLGRHVIVGHGATVENDCSLGDETRIQTGAYITAHSTLAEKVFVAPMVTTTNDNYVGRTEERFKHRKGVTVERGGRIGGNAVVLPGVTVGQEALVAAGSVVTRDVPGYTVVMGVPARPVRPVPQEQLLFPEATSPSSVGMRPSMRQGREPAPADSDPPSFLPSASAGETRPSGPDTDALVSAPVPVFDLTRQNAQLSHDLLEALSAVIASGHFILGEEVSRLEERIAHLCGARHAIGVGNASDALYLALLAFGIKPGAEVITTAFSFFATAGCIARVGATPVFCDIDPRTFNMDPEQLEACITPRTQAILPVHLYGLPADMDPILDVARRHHLLVIEDAAQALGARYKNRPVGSLGDAGCISFFPTKPLGAFGDGGIVVTNDDQAAERLRMLRVHGSKVKYHNEMLGVNSRLDALQAAILNVKLPHLPAWTERRRALAQRYTKLLPDTALFAHSKAALPMESPDKYHVYHQYTVRVQDRDRFRHHLEEHGIGTAVYYPIPLHLLPVFQNLGYPEGSLPQAEAASRQVVSLPLFPELTDAEQDRVVKAIAGFRPQSR